MHLAAVLADRDIFAELASLIIEAETGLVVGGGGLPKSTLNAIVIVTGPRSWFRQFETDQRVMDFMRRNQRFMDLARVCQAQGNPTDARRHLLDWICRLPRQIERPLARLLDAGLITEAEHAMLGRASQQGEDHYREMVRAWSSDAQSPSRPNHPQQALAGTPSSSLPGGPSS